MQRTGAVCPAREIRLPCGERSRNKKRSLELDASSAPESFEPLTGSVALGRPSSACAGARRLSPTPRDGLAGGHGSAAPFGYPCCPALPRLRLLDGDDVVGVQ